MIRVLLADDEAMIRAGVRAILSADPGIEVIAEAATGHQAVELTLRHRPEVTLLDIRMPQMDGLAAAAELHRVAPTTGVIILTTFGEDDYIAQALSGGASGFLLKSGDPHDLIAGVRAVADGAAYLYPKVTHRVSTHLNSGRMSSATRARERTEGLTPREGQVLALLGAGLSNAEIAGRLHIVEGTVKAYVSAILTRLDIRNRVQAAVIAYEAGLVDGINETPRTT